MAQKPVAPEPRNPGTSEPRNPGTPEPRTPAGPLPLRTLKIAYNSPEWPQM